MGKFGGLGSLGSFNVSSIQTAASNAVNKATSKIENMSTDELTGLIDKVTIGNAASWAGSKVGLNINGGKIDGVVNKYYDLKASLRSRFLDAVLGSAKSLGYEIQLPDSEKIADYIMNSGVMDKITSASGEIANEDIKRVVKSIDIPKVADEIGLSIKKVPKVETNQDTKTLLGGINSNVAGSLSGVGSVLGTELTGAKGDIESALADIKDIAKGE